MSTPGRAAYAITLAAPIAGKVAALSGWRRAALAGAAGALSVLAQAPFHAVKLERVVMGVPTVGLKVDERARVIDARGRPVNGLYAAGNATAWLDIGGGYNSGIANTRGLLQGYLAARDLIPPG